MKDNKAYDGFFKHENGVCQCTVCGATASKATKIEHAPNCIVGKTVAEPMKMTIEERIDILEHALSEIEGKVDTLNRLLKKMGSAFTKLDAPR